MILACRNTSKGYAAKRSIEESTQRFDVVDVWGVDLGMENISTKLLCLSPIYTEPGSILLRFSVLLRLSGLKYFLCSFPPPNPACIERKNYLLWNLPGSYASIQKFCACVGKLERLDAVVENAGIATPHYEEFEGMESTITINVISTFLMALLLLPKLRADGVKYNMVPRIVVVSSDAHEQVGHSTQANSCNLC